MSVHFNRSFSSQQQDTCPQQQIEQLHDYSNATSHQVAYDASSNYVGTAISDQRYQQNNMPVGHNQMTQNTMFNHLSQKSEQQIHQRSVFPSFRLLNPHHSSINQFNNSQQENRSFQQQTQACSQSSIDQQINNTKQLYSSPCVPATVSSNQHTKCFQSSEEIGFKQTSQYPVFNQLPPNPYYASQRPVLTSCNTQRTSQSNLNRFSNNPPIQQPNTNLQQTQLCSSSNLDKHQTTSNIQQPCSIPSDLIRMTTPISSQQNRGFNQTSQFSTFNRFSSNFQHQANQQHVITSVSQISHQTNVSSHFNNTVPSHQENRCYQQQHQMHYQPNAANANQLIGNRQHLCDIQVGVTNITSPIPSQHTQHQQNSFGSNQTSQFVTFNQLAPKSQHHPVQKSAIPSVSQISHQTNVISHFSNTPSNQQENRNVQQQTQLCYQSSCINSPVMPKVSHQSVISHVNNLPTQQENLQQAQPHHQSHAINDQPGNIQQSYVITSGSTSILPISSDQSQGQQNSKTCELNNQIPSFNQLPSTTQPELNQTQVFSSNAHTCVPLSGPPAQPNHITPAVLQYGPPSNFTNSYPLIYTQQDFRNYQTLTNVCGTNTDNRMKSQSEVDSEWISQWLVARRRERTAENKRSTITIPMIRKLLYQALAYLKSLTSIRDTLKSCMNESNGIWEHKHKQAMNIKHKLNSVMEKLFQPDLTLEIVSRLNRIKKKRELHRKQREKRKMQRLEQQKKRLEIHRYLDSYMETEKEKVLQAKREEEMKRDADNILSEVRRKLQEGKRAQERLRMIEKLRQARKDTAQKRGLHISEETDSQFNKKISFLKEIVHKQLIDYEAEEKALKVMLETEQEGQREKDESGRKERQQKLLNKMQNRITECLFGDSDPLDTSDPLWYFRQYYTQAENNLDALVQTRRQWDMYLVRPTDARGSSISITWVIPDPPSSHSWASAINMEDYK